MALFDNFPYTNFHELNADWLIQVAKQADVAANTVDSKIAAETERATNAEKDLQTNINNEVTRATNAEKTNATSLSAMGLRLDNTIAENKRQSEIMDDSLQEQITENKNNIAANAQAVIDEKNRALAAENGLQKTISQVEAYGATTRTYLNDLTRITALEPRVIEPPGTSLTLVQNVEFVTSFSKTMTLTPPANPVDGEVCAATFYNLDTMAHAIRTDPSTATVPFVHVLNNATASVNNSIDVPAASVGRVVMRFSERLASYSENFSGWIVWLEVFVKSSQK